MWYEYSACQCPVQVSVGLARNVVGGSDKPFSWWRYTEYTLCHLQYLAFLHIWLSTSPRSGGGGGGGVCRSMIRDRGGGGVLGEHTMINEAQMISLSLSHVDPTHVLIPIP